MGDVILPGVNSGNARIWKVQKFLTKPPKGTVKLVMMAAQAVSESGPLQLCEWEKDEILPELAADILAKLDEHATEMGGAVQCNLTYEGANGKALGTHVLKRQANHVEDFDGAEVTAKMLQGDAQGMVVHATASSLALQRVYMTGIVNLMSFQERAAERAEMQNVELRKQVARLEAERDQLARELSQLEAALNAGDGDAPAPTAAQVEALSLLKQLAPLLVARLMTPGAVAGAAVPS